MLHNVFCLKHHADDSVYYPNVCHQNHFVLLSAKRRDNNNLDRESNIKFPPIEKEISKKTNNGVEY